MGFFSGLYSGLKQFASNVWDKVKSPIMSVYNATKPFHGAIFGAIKTPLKDMATGLADKLPAPLQGFAKDQISKLKRGGKVISMKPTVQGGTHAYVMHDGIPQNSFQR